MSPETREGVRLLTHALAYCTESARQARNRRDLEVSEAYSCAGDYIYWALYCLNCKLDS